MKPKSNFSSKVDSHRAKHSTHHANGISLIALIITIIVIIILAAIVIFSGLNTPDRANLAKFMQEISDFRTAITQDYMQKKAEYAINKQTRSDAQIYYAIATGSDYTGDINQNPTATGTVASLGITVVPEALIGNDYYEITDDSNVKDWKTNKSYYTARGESGEKHFVTDKGEPFILPGYLVQENGQNRWYVNEKKYYISDEPIVVSGALDESTKLYTALKDIEPQEIANGVIIDGIETHYIGASDYYDEQREPNGIMAIEYNNQYYYLHFKGFDFALIRCGRRKGRNKNFSCS